MNLKAALESAWQRLAFLLIFFFILVGMVLIHGSAHSQIQGNAFGEYGVQPDTYYRNASVTVNTPWTNPSRALAFECSAGGTVTITMAGGTTVTAIVPVGHFVLPYAATNVTSIGSATCANIYAMY